MNNEPDIIMEYEIRGMLEAPQLEFFGVSLEETKKISRNVLLRKTEEILILSKICFSIDSIFAGLSEKQIEFFSKNAPMEYREELMEIFKNQEMMNGVWEIAKSMDEDAGDGSTKNQDRVKNVIQYIQDNRIVFQV